MTIHTVSFDNKEYWKDFFHSGCLMTLVDVSPTDKFSIGDKLHIINRESTHYFFPFGKTYGKVKGVLSDPDIVIPEDMAVIYYQNFGFLYIYFAGFFGLLGICCLLSLLGVI